MTSKVHIQTEYNEAVTILRSFYADQPFKVADISEDSSEALQIMLMNSSPGILDGDDYFFKIDLGENSIVQLETQSYQRLFAMKKGASQKMEVQMEQRSSLYYIPHPVVPHQTSTFTSFNKIYLKDDCRLYWGEILTCGRKLTGEIFRFSKYHNHTQIFINGILAIKENLLVDPVMADVKALGQMEGYTHQASLLCVDEQVDAERILHLLSLEEGIEYGVTSAPVKGFVVRILGHKAEQLYRCLQAVSIMSNINTFKNAG